MLRDYGDWHVEENIDADLARYDHRWLVRADSKLRKSLLETLRRAKLGEYDHPA
jgi:hypothetical protein